MNNKINSFSNKPLENNPTKQLFSYDVTVSGAKNFLFSTYEQIYTVIKSQKDSNFYEDNTFSKSIKLFIDFDDKIIFNNVLERDKYAEKITGAILSQINTKLYETFKIKDPSVIILMSDTLLKMSLHFVYPDVIFNNIHEIKYFMDGIKLVDHSVYKIGCFRMMYCSKMGKNNILLFSNSVNYVKPKTDYELFLDTCICHASDDKPKVKIDMPIVIKTLNNKAIKHPKNIKIGTKQIKRNYVYKNVNLTMIKKTLEKLKSYSKHYNEWLIISFCLKDLYLGSNPEEQTKIYDLFNEFSKTSDNYHESNNKKIFMSLEPKIDINCLFNISGEQYYISPFYNYREIIFNPKKHANIIIKNEKYIDVDTDALLKYKYIFIKSPTGTGKTTFLKEIVTKCGIDNILSITSRVNVAGEHTKQLGLKFYLNLQMNDYFACDKLVVQLESLKKCNYKLFRDGVIILDEVNSLLSHLRSPTMNNRRRDTYMYLIELIKNAKYVISMDADLSDWNIDFLQEIKKDDYVVYYNENKNKTGTKTIIYKCPNVMIECMINQINKKKYFISCFDSLKQMNKIIEYLSQFGNKNEWLIYSSEILYDLIDTKLWTDKFVFFTPTIIYGIDYNYKIVDVFSFVYKNHLNPLQVYQMISRARQQNNVHIFCNERESFVRYKCVEDVIQETELYETNFGLLLPLYNNYIDINDGPYRIMYYNFRYMDAMLKTNIKGYLIDMLNDKGYDISYNDTFEKVLMDKKTILKNIKEKVVSLLCLDVDNLTILENKLATDDKALEKHFNLRILLNNKIDERLDEAITKNLFIETLKSKYTKIKICSELMSVLEIPKLNCINKAISKKFAAKIENKWLDENIKTIKKTFDIRTDKYDTNNYHNIYLLLIALLKNMFDNDLFKRKIIEINASRYPYYAVNEQLLDEHEKIMKHFNATSQQIFL